MTLNQSIILAASSFFAGCVVTYIIKKANEYQRPQLPKRDREFIYPNKFYFADDADALNELQDSGLFIIEGVIANPKNILLTPKQKQAIDYLLVNWDYVYAL